MLFRPLAPSRGAWEAAGDPDHCSPAASLTEVLRLSHLLRPLVAGLRSLRGGPELSL